MTTETKKEKPEELQLSLPEAEKKPETATPAAKPKRPQQTFLDECAG